MNNPTTLITVIVVLSCAAASIFLAVRNSRRKSDWRELNNAARKLVKEQNLSATLLDGRTKRERVRMVIALRWKGQKKEAFVFDPQEGVRIGRQPERNNVVVPDVEVSLSHCVLYRERGGKRVILEDLGSTNGTVIFHGLRKRKIRSRRVYAFDGDRIQVGSMQMELRVFWVDSAFV